MSFRYIWGFCTLSDKARSAPGVIIECDFALGDISVGLMI